MGPAQGQAHKKVVELGLRYSKYNILYTIPRLHQIAVLQKENNVGVLNKNIQCKCFCYRMVKQQNLGEAASGQFSTCLLS